MKALLLALALTHGGLTDRHEEPVPLGEQGPVAILDASDLGDPYVPPEPAGTVWMALGVVLAAAAGFTLGRFGLPRN